MVTDGIRTMIRHGVKNKVLDEEVAACYLQILKSLQALSITYCRH